jgi:hypothetical protein
LIIRHLQIRTSELPQKVTTHPPVFLSVLGIRRCFKFE